MPAPTCCFTGHRELPEEKIPEIKRRLAEEIVCLISEGVTRFAAGGALGFDTLAALAVLQMKVLFAELELTLVLPCKTQDRYWRQAEKELYREILSQADHVTYVSEQYTRGCIQKRNRLLVEGSSVCVCYCAKNQGGTAYTVQYARKKGHRVINLAE